MTSRLGAAVAEALAGCIGVARGFYICRPWVPKAAGGDSMAVPRPKAAPESFDFCGRVASLGDLHPQPPFGLPAKPLRQSCDQWMSIVRWIGHEPVRLTLVCFDFGTRQIQADGVHAQGFVKLNPGFHAFDDFVGAGAGQRQDQKRIYVFTANAALALVKNQKLRPQTHFSISKDWNGNPAVASNVLEQPDGLV